MNVKEHKIMLVDDESEILAHVKRTLEKEGFYRVITASDVAEAKRLLEAEKPHLLVLDVVLPDGDGFEILQYARRNSYVPAIFLTARDEDDDKADCDNDVENPHGWGTVVVKRIAEMHGGKAVFEAATGGMKVSITIPVERQQKLG